VIESGFFPKILGRLLIAACVGYVAASLTYFLLPTKAHLVTHVGQLVGGIGEGAMLLWLLVKGADVPTARS